MLTYRFSTNKDRDTIRELIGKRFGNRDKYKPFDNLEERYYLAFNDNKLIAMTGISSTTDYKGLEIDWTCIDKEYEGQGIITNMLNTLLVVIDKPVFCSCWRIKGRRTNLYSVMNKLGFKHVIENRLRYNSKYYSLCKECCINYESDDSCWCQEDLYVKYPDTIDIP